MSTKPTARRRTSTPAKPGSFELSSRYMAETIDVKIKDPETGKPCGMIFTIASQYSKEARDASMSATKLRITDAGEVEASSVASVADTILEQLIAVTRSWNIMVDGVPLPCTPENVRTVLTDVRTAWVRPDVQSAYLSLSRFFDSAKAS